MPRKSKEEKAAYQRAWRAANPEYVRTWRASTHPRDPARGRKAKANDLTWDARNPDKRISIQRKHKLKKKFKLTLSQYDEMLKAQNFVCAICGIDKPGSGNDNFPVDHCHKTNRVRGLLCHHCNFALGNVKDNINILQQMIKYLEIAASHQNHIQHPAAGDLFAVRS